MHHRTQAVQGHPGARAWPRGPDGGAWGPQDLSPIPSEQGYLPLVRGGIAVSLLLLPAPTIAADCCVADAGQLVVAMWVLRLSALRVVFRQPIAKKWVQCLVCGALV